MDISVQGAQSLLKGISKGGQVGTESISHGDGKSFQDVFKKLAQDTTASAYQLEKSTMAQAIGDMDLTKLSTDVAQLEIMINGLVSVRDKVVTAWADLQKMQI